MRLYNEPRPLRYGIKGNQNDIGFIYEAPETIEEAKSGSNKVKIRFYKLYGIIVRPIGETDTGSGHFECFVRTQEKKNRKEIWRHFDDDQDIKEYDINRLPNLDKYTIVAVFLKDVTISPHGDTLMMRRRLAGMISNNFQT